MPLTKISAMMDMTTLRRFDRVAKREGYSRSAYLRLLIASAVQGGGRE